VSQLSTLLIHPSADVRSGLRESLEQVDFLRVLGEAVAAEEALALLDAVPYGVFFLGVGLGGDMDGFELAHEISGRKNAPALIYVADDEGPAFTAFELGATDYILWPYTEERLARTVERLRRFKAHFKEVPPPERWEELPAEDVGYDEERTVQLPMEEDEEDQFVSALRAAWEFTSKNRPLEIEKLAVNLDGRTILIPYNRIIFIEAYEDYSYVHTADQKFLTSYRLKNLEDRLRPHRFFRVHRKFLVNLDMVTEIASLPGSNFMLRTMGKTRIELPISRRRIADLKTILGL
jgi:DNA-binding LytR/AlgR family response regulator